MKRLKIGTLISHGGLLGRIRKHAPAMPGEWYYCEIYRSKKLWKIKRKYLVVRQRSTVDGAPGRHCERTTGPCHR
jgi:hypothetical protein